MENNKNPDCIVRAFENNSISILQENINNKTVYYFKASDVAKVLDISQIRSSIQNYDSDEKVVRKVNDLRGCDQDTTFLTSHGVYRLLYNSKKDIAKKFRKWVGNILDDIIFNNSIELQKQLEQHKKKLEENKRQFALENNEMQKTNEKEKKMIKEQTYITSYHKRAVVYLVTIDKTLVKFGYTNDIKERISVHKRTYGNEAYLSYVIETNSNRLLETYIKQHHDIRCRIVSKEFNNKTRTELIQLDDIGVETGDDIENVNQKSRLFTFDKLVNIIILLKENYKHDVEIMTMEHIRKMKELVLLELQEKTKQLELTLELEKLKASSVLSTSTSNVNNNIDSNNIDSNTENGINWHEKFMNEKTEHSDNYNDKIKMIELYDEFNKWIKESNPNFKFTNRSRFATYIKNVDFICYKSSIKAFGIKYSGVTNRKFKN